MQNLLTLIKTNSNIVYFVVLDMTIKTTCISSTDKLVKSSEGQKIKL